MKSWKETYFIATSEVDCRKSYKAFAFMNRTQEIANTHATKIGFGYRQLMENNTIWVLSRMKVKYVGAPVWEQEVDLTTWHKGMESIFALRDFELRDHQSGDLLIAATSSWLILDVNTRKMLRPDHQAGVTYVDTILNQNAIEEVCGKLTCKEEKRLVMTKEVMYSDVDFNMHTNNAKYVEWAFDCIPLELSSKQGIDWYQINFNHETVLGDKVELYLAECGENACYVEGKIEEKTIFQIFIQLKP